MRTECNHAIVQAWDKIYRMGVVLQIYMYISHMLQLRTLILNDKKQENTQREVELLRYAQPVLNPWKSSSSCAQLVIV